MGIRRLLATLVTATLVLAALALVLGSLLGQPILLSYVETESMQPTLDPGDGFVAVPSAVAGPVEQGDVVVFQAQELHGGGLTTHRVVGRTNQGYVTGGDNNPFTDQAGTEPPVADEQIVAEALKVNGEVLVIPHLGDVVTGLSGGLEDVRYWLAAFTGLGIFAGPQGLPALLILGLVLYYAVDVLRERGQRQYDRTTERETGLNTRLVVGALAVFLVFSATMGMVGPSGTNEYGIVSAAYEDERQDVVPAGESKNNTLGVTNGGFLPVVVFYEPGDMADVHPREVYVPARGEANVTATFTAPPETGGYSRYIVERRYFAVLPVSVIRSLYQVHPWLPIVAIDLLLGVPFYVAGRKLLGSGRIRERTRDRGLSRLASLKRALRGRE
ncbi:MULTISPECIES: signal peptidase I [Salinibaculum]|uniref:signal peptidase I n=1 Tax=Salinibaculum TaxID=2732368 RepID=UPI0030CF3050